MSWAMKQEIVKKNEYSQQAGCYSIFQLIELT